MRVFPETISQLGNVYLLVVAFPAIDGVKKRGFVFLLAESEEDVKSKMESCYQELYPEAAAIAPLEIDKISVFAEHVWG